MPPKKSPLTERDPNATPRTSSKSKQSAKDNASTQSPSLMDVANNITKTHGKKRSHEDENAKDSSNQAKATDTQQGEKSRPAKKTKTSEDDSSKSTKEDSNTSTKGNTSKSTKNNTSKSKKDSAKDKFDVSDITLPNEEKGRVPIFDTCDDIRTKINAHLRQPNTSQAALGRMMSLTYAKSGDSTEKVTGTHISRFLQKKGPNAGAMSSVYYAGYVFFEKLRLKDNKPKSKKRTEMEQVHPATGCPTDVDANTSYIARWDSRPHVDKYGVVSFG